MYKNQRKQVLTQYTFVLLIWHYYFVFSKYRGVWWIRKIILNLLFSDNIDVVRIKDFLALSYYEASNGAILLLNLVVRIGSADGAMALEFGEKFEGRRTEILTQVKVPLDHQSIITTDAAHKRLQLFLVIHGYGEPQRIILYFQAHSALVNSYGIKVGDLWDVLPLKIFQ